MTVVVFFLLPLLSLGEETTEVAIGTAKIVIPVPAGFQVLPLQNGQVAKLIDQMYPLGTQNDRLATFFRTSDIQANAPLDARLRSFDIQTLRLSQNSDLTLSYFSSEKSLIRTNFAEQKLNQIGNERAQSDRKQEQSTTYEHEMLPISYETERAIVFSVLWKVGSMDEKGERKVVESAVSSCIMLLKGKAVFVYIHGSKEDLEWTKKEAVGIAESLQRLNPSDMTQAIAEKTGIDSKQAVSAGFAGPNQSTNIPNQLYGLLGIVVVAALVSKYYDDRFFPISKKYSTFGPRFWTGSIDALVLWPLGFVSSILLGFSYPVYIATIIVLCQNLISLLYTVIMHARYGQTVGKMVCKVKVVDFPTENRISFSQALIREGIPILLSAGIAGYLVFSVSKNRSPDGTPRVDLLNLKPLFWLGAVTSIWFFAEIATMFTNKKRRSLHDFLARTVVVRTNVEDL